MSERGTVRSETFVYQGGIFTSESESLLKLGVI